MWPQLLQLHHNYRALIEQNLFRCQNDKRAKKTLREQTALSLFPLPDGYFQCLSVNIKYGLILNFKKNLHQTKRAHGAADVGKHANGRAYYTVWRHDARVCRHYNARPNPCGLLSVPAGGDRAYCNNNNNINNALVCIHTDGHNSVGRRWLVVLYSHGIHTHTHTQGVISGVCVRWAECECVCVRWVIVRRRGARQKGRDAAATWRVWQVVAVRFAKGGEINKPSGENLARPQTSIILVPGYPNACARVFSYMRRYAWMPRRVRR